MEVWISGVICGVEDAHGDVDPRTGYGVWVHMHYSMYVGLKSGEVYVEV